MTKTRKNKRNPKPNPKHKTGGSEQDLSPRTTEEINKLYSEYSKILEGRIKGPPGRSMSLNRPPDGNGQKGTNTNTKTRGLFGRLYNRMRSRPVFSSKSSFK
jgi:hypothetical protein